MKYRWMALEAPKSIGKAFHWIPVRKTKKMAARTFRCSIGRSDDASVFWENVKKEIKAQNTTQEWVAKNAGASFNTFQGWISKGIYPRVNEAIRIAVSLNKSVEYLAIGSVQNNNESIETICRNLPQIQDLLEKTAMREVFGYRRIKKGGTCCPRPCGPGKRSASFLITFSLTARKHP
jgi:transcriptional regulator with XRE-family HTH domain